MKRELGLCTLTEALQLLCSHMSEANVSMRRDHTEWQYYAVRDYGQRRVPESSKTCEAAALAVSTLPERDVRGPTAAKDMDMAS